MHRKPLGLIAAATAAALSAAVAVPVLSGAQTPASRTITFQETPPRVAIDDIAPKSKSKLSLGDRIVIGGALYDTSRKKLGTFGGQCTAVGVGRSFVSTPLLCSATYRVADGQIIASGMTTLAKTDLAIVGGTGAYADVHGTVTSTVKPAKGFEDADLLTIDG